MMKVSFYGVRGSIATAGDETRRYGGNTSCVGITLGGPSGGRQLIFDAGTGIRKLGNELMKSGPVDAHLFFSHLHWDHIQGFPFFAPAFVPGNRLHVYGVRSPVDVEGSATTQEIQLAALGKDAPVVDTSSVKAAMAAQMTAPNFPVGLEAMRASLEFLDVPYGEQLRLGGSLPSDGAIVRHVGVDHPNGCVAWRVDHDGRSVVYATDLELAEGTGGAVFDALVDLARGVDLLVFDAMYTPEEYDGVGTFSRRGWGHSTFEMGAAVAEAAHVGRLCLFHHDPGHDDAFMDALAERARRRLSTTIVAMEGMEVTL
jgi:phosphoribosyl 1,2-cyclic phosphodiesterase